MKTFVMYIPYASFDKEKLEKITDNYPCFYWLEAVEMNCIAVTVTCRMDDFKTLFVSMGKSFDVAGVAV